MIDLLNFKVEDVFQYHKKKVICDISDEMILEWYRLNDITNSPMLNKFLEYSPTVSAEELMSKGFAGKTLGEEIKRLEVLAFKKLINYDCW